MGSVSVHEHTEAHCLHSEHGRLLSRLVSPALSILSTASDLRNAGELIDWPKILLTVSKFKDVSGNGSLACWQLREENEFCKRNFSPPPKTHFSTLIKNIRKKAGERLLSLAVAKVDPLQLFLFSFSVAEEKTFQEFLSGAYVAILGVVVSLEIGVNCRIGKQGIPEECWIRLANCYMVK